MLLLDEPGLGVDPLSRRELWQMLEEFCRSGVTIVFATSYMDEAERCDRIAFLDGGRLISQGTPEELRARAGGAVFQVKTQAPAVAEKLLVRAPGILGVQWLPRGIRFVTDPATGLVEELRARLETLGSLEASAPMMEDVFVILRKDEGEIAPFTTAETSNITGSGPRDKAAVRVEAERLTRRFGGFVAVDGVSMTVNAGEIFGLLGANGAGKTTLIRMLCGLLAPSSGTGRVAGIELAIWIFRRFAR